MLSASTWLRRLVPRLWRVGRTQLDCLIVQTSNIVPGCEQAHVLLPSATYAERDGTFTNFQGVLQRLNAAFAPRGEALPAWQIYTRLARGLGQDWTYASAEGVLHDIAVAIPALCRA